MCRTLPFRGPTGGDVDKENATSNQKILALALAGGTLVGYGDDENQMHSPEGFTHANWWRANSSAGAMKVLEARALFSQNQRRRLR